MHREFLGALSHSPNHRFEAPLTSEAPVMVTLEGETDPLLIAEKVWVPFRLSMGEVLKSFLFGFL